MNVLAVIPARGGSKGIPRKNLYPIGGKPLIAYTLEAVQASKLITWSVVSTDDDEIASVSRSLGGNVPFIRPPALATDEATQLDVVLHAIAEVETAGEQPVDVVVLLQPTTPLRTAGDIDSALQLLTDTDSDSVVSMHRVEQGHPYYMYTLEDNLPQPLLPESQTFTRRQQFPAVYLRNGGIYATKRDVLVNQHSFYGKKSHAYVMPAERSTNIDAMMDIRWVEFLLSRPANGL
jgi:CMP-N,N'-diacetyllegionaminic acid synthase